MIDELANNSSGRRKMAPGGGGFIVSGVFNDSSKMYIPAPPSPTPDYDDEGNDSDGNESDILHDSQFYVVNDDLKERKNGSSNKTNRSKNQFGPGKLDSKSGESRGPNNPGDTQTPFQNMIDKFHQRLPHHEHEDESRFSDDSLEGSSAPHDSVSAASVQRSKRQDSMESLASIEESTTSFDYVTSAQANSHELNRPIIAGGENVVYKARKDIKSNNPRRSIPKSKSETGPKGFKVSDKKSSNVKKTSRQDSRESNQSSSSSGSKHSEKFDTIRNMLKQGLIEGLDESPPDFKPPPPPKGKISNSNSEERTDSGLGSTVSTNRTDESGASDNHSDQSTSPPSMINSTSATPTSLGPSISRDKLRDRDTVRSHISVKSEVHERDRDEGDEVEIHNDEREASHSPTPPPPPPRDSSMQQSISSSYNSSNPSWLHNNKKQNQKRPGNASGKKPAVPPPRNEMLEVPHSSIYSRNPGKITHIDDIYSHGATYKYDSEDNPLTDREFIENMKNLETHHLKPESLPVISEDRNSTGSRSSTRSSRLLSRFTDSMKSGLGSRPSTPSNTTKTTTKLTSSSRSSTRIHGDIIREPWKNTSSLPTPPDYPQLVSPSTVVPLSRDGSGRYRSIEDLAEAASIEQNDRENMNERRKKHSTLPPNLTPADIRKENKELRRATSLMCSNKGKGKFLPFFITSKHARTFPLLNHQVAITYILICVRIFITTYLKPYFVI